MEVVLQTAAKNIGEALLPTQSDFERWAEAALVRRDLASGKSEVCVRLVGNDESAELNWSYRSCARPTNVLAFACEAEFLPVDGSDYCPLGDIVIAVPIVIAEAREQGKRLTAHWAHLFVHGMLHLQGYDHAEEKDAQRMEAREADILGRLGFPDPYRQVDGPAR